MYQTVGRHLRSFLYAEISLCQRKEKPEICPPVSRLSAPCRAFVGEVEEYPSPPVLAACATRGKADPHPWRAGGFPHGYRVENQAGERGGAAWRLSPSSLRSAEPAASRLSTSSERNAITVPDLGKRFLVRCFHSLKTRGFNE